MGKVKELAAEIAGELGEHPMSDATIVEYELFTHEVGKYKSPCCNEAFTIRSYNELECSKCKKVHKVNDIFK